MCVWDGGGGQLLWNPQKTSPHILFTICSIWFNLNKCDVSITSHLSTWIKLHLNVQWQPVLFEVFYVFHLGVLSLNCGWRERKLSWNRCQEDDSTCSPGRSPHWPAGTSLLLCLCLRAQTRQCVCVCAQVCVHASINVCGLSCTHFSHNARFLFHTSLCTYAAEHFSPYPTDGPFKLKWTSITLIGGVENKAPALCSQQE